MIEGIRGSGKTVLMTSIAGELSENDDWIVIDLNSTQNLIDDFASRLVDSCSKMPDILKKGFSVSVAGFGVGINGGKASGDSVSIIDGILSSLKKKNKRVCVTIDEVMHDDNMRHFASQFQIFLRKDYPLFLLMTGLYENIYAVQNDPALTFLLRTPKIRLEPLSLNQITKQYMSTLGIEQDKAKELASITKGYAFAFQALGMLCFENRDDMNMDVILSKLDDMLDDFVYRKIWDSLSEKDRIVVLKVKDTDTKVGEICAELSMSSGDFSKYRERLLRKGVIRSNRHGYVSLALPRFEKVVEMYA